MSTTTFFRFECERCKTVVEYDESEKAPACNRIGISGDDTSFFSAFNDGRLTAEVCRSCAVDFVQSWWRLDRG